MTKQEELEKYPNGVLYAANELRRQYETINSENKTNTQKESQVIDFEEKTLNQTFSRK